MSAAAWRVADIPDQRGRTVVVTGPSVGGIGHHAALELARRGARVVLAGRAAPKLADAAAAIRGEVPDADLDEQVVDLADLGSVRQAGAALERVGPIDVLVNNAGVMGTPHARTADGFDLQLATNHLGPFLLTGLLLPQLRDGAGGRVVTVSSIFHRFASAPPAVADVHYGRVRTWQRYGETKLANLLFTHELDRRCREANLPVTAFAAHPGFAGTHLAANGQYGRSRGGLATILDAAIRAVSQSAAAGAWPTLMAATAPLPGGTFVGPSGLGELGGAPRIVTSDPAAHDVGAMRALWEASEAAVGLRYP